MSYTAPQYVDTKEKAVLALASTIAGEDKTNLGDGSVNTALDVLADVLAGQDVEVPQTNAGAILALAQYVQGGGGGGAQTTDIYLWNFSDPEGGNADKLPSIVAYFAGYEGGEAVYNQLQFEPITEEVKGETVYGVKVKDCPAGALFGPQSFGFMNVGFGGIVFDYSNDAMHSAFIGSIGAACPMPIDGLYVVGNYSLVSMPSQG